MNPEVAATTLTASDTRFFGHPRGVATLFFTEMWERFSYYGMRAFLIYYLVTPEEHGGMGMLDATGGIILGCYTASVYLMSVPGGWIADRFLGLRRAVLIGGILIMSGHVVLAIPIKESLYLGLLLIVLGTGLLKPNVSAIVGQLYAANDKRRDSGYSIYYMGINLGAFIAPLVCGYLGQQINWHLGFGAAGVGMTMGVIQYLLGSGKLGSAGVAPGQDPSSSGAARDRRTAITWSLIGIALALVIGVGGYTGALPITATQVSIVVAISVAGPGTNPGSAPL